MAKHKKKRSFQKESNESGTNVFKIYTDGSYRPEGNASCAFLIFSEKTKHIVALESIAFKHSTINQMELQGVNKALDYPGMDHIVIYSDSMYTISALTLWCKSWARNNWMTPIGQPVKNKELIQEILAKMESKKSVKFVKVQAHSGDPYNSLVDYLAAGLSSKMRDNPSIINQRYKH